MGGGVLYIMRQIIFLKSVYKTDTTLCMSMNFK